MRLHQAEFVRFRPNPSGFFRRIRNPFLAIAFVAFVQIAVAIYIGFLPYMEFRYIALARGLFDHSGPIDVTLHPLYSVFLYVFYKTTGNWL